MDGGRARAKGRRARIKTRLEGPHCLVNRRETAHRLPMRANETLEGRGSLPSLSPSPFTANYERPIKGGRAAGEE